MTFLTQQEVLSDGQTVKDGRIIAEKLMSSLGVKNNKILAGAYIDMVLERHSNE